LADRSISIAIEARVQGFVAGMRTAQQATTDFASRTAAFARDNEQHLDRVGKASMVMGGAVLAGLALAIKAASEFDSAMSEVQASTHETAGNMALLREAAINAGADTSFSAKEAAQAIDELAKAGVSTKDILSGGLSGALSLAAAGGLAVADAAEIAATSMTIFGKDFADKGKLAAHVADLLAAGAGKAQGSVADMGAALKQAGLVANQTGLSIEETTGGLAAFASAGLIGSDAGTSFKSMLQRLTPQSKEAKAEMDKLGISAYDSSGEFIGLAKFADNLKTSMQDLTPEARNAAMGVIFGSDAVRAANVLYENGGKGIADWTNKVNESGYAAVTAQLKTDNLAGDLERLGGSFDSVLIKGGSSAAQSLRGVVQSAEKLIDAVGQIPAPLMNLGVGIAGIAGSALLLGGGLMTSISKVTEFRASIDALSSSANPAARGLGKVAKAASLAAAAMVGLEIFNAIAYDKHTQSTEQLGNAILKLNKAAASDGISSLNAALSDFGNFAGRKIAPDINSAADAIARITHPQGADGINRWADQAFGWTGLAKSETTQVDESLKSLGDQLGDLAKNGAADAAAASFKKLSDEFVKNGSSAQDALNHVPGYRDALLSLSKQVGVNLSDQELLDFALGKVPASMLSASGATETYTNAAGKAVPVTEDMAKELEKIGVSAKGTITILSAFVDVMFRAGLLTLSERDAQRGYAEALAAVGLAADGTGGKVGAMGTAFDNTTEQGRKNQAMFDAVARAGMATTQTMAETTDAFGKNVYTQDQLQANLVETYNNLISAAGQFGITGDAAVNLARDVLKIPANANINTWMSDYALNLAKQTTGELNKLDGRQVRIGVNTVYTETGPKPDGYVARNGVPAYNATGGRVNYLAGGGQPILYDMQPRGTDTVPTMLTPGEFVVNRDDTAKNLPLLEAINAGRQYRPAPAPARQVIASAGGVGDVTVYVTNPFTGEEVQGIVRSVASGVAAAQIQAADSQSQFSRRGR